MPEISGGDYLSRMCYPMELHISQNSTSVLFSKHEWHGLDLRDTLVVYEVVGRGFPAPFSLLLGIIKKIYIKKEKTSF